MSGKWKFISGWLAAIVILDQLTKVIVDRTMALYQSIAIVDGLFSFTYVRNPGAAFGIFAGNAAIYRRPFLILVSILASGFIVTLLQRLDGRERGLITALTFILGGAVGNLIDRSDLRRSDRFPRRLLAQLSLAGIQCRRQFHHHRRRRCAFQPPQAQGRRSLRRPGQLRLSDF